MNDYKDINFRSPFCVGDWTVDPAKNLIHHGEHLVNLEPKVMDLLVYLAERQGQVISREELENNVWAGRVVSYDALTNSMVKLRKALDSSKENPVIRTVSKRGYNLVAEVTPIIAETTKTTKAIEENPLHTSQPSSTLSDLPSDSLPEAKEHAEPERRQVTVVSCELLNAASLYDQIDPEDVHELLQHLQKSCTDVVKQYGGHIGYYTNGEMVIYYGYPEAHEGDAERAVRTALGLVESVHHLAGKLPAFKKHLEVRMGIHTGLVVVGEMTEDNVHERMSVVGDTPSRSAALKQLAQPDTVVVSETTKRLVDKFFVFDKLQSNTDHGLSSQNIYCVQAMQYTPSRSETKLTETLTPLVGRETEIDLLLNRWEQSRAGESQVAMLCAEAGIGKSRILQGLQERLQDEPHERVLYFCSPYHTNSSLYPVIVHLQRTLKIQLNEDADQSLDKLEAFINDLGLVVAESAPVFGELLSLPVQERYTGFNLQQAEVKRRTFDCLVAMFSAMAQREPVLLILEDAHWADPTTRELTEQLINELRSQPVFFVTSYRPEFDPPWSAYMQATLLRLNRLTRNEIIGIIENITGSRTLPNDILELIISRTDGVPLFVEELTKSVLMSGALHDSDDGPELTGTLQTINIPDSLQDSLMARLDKLKHSKRIAQLAATVGRSINHALLKAVAEEDEEQLDRALTELINEELLFKRGMAPDVTYEFKHVLVQDAAYQSLLKSKRQQIHHHIAEVLEQQFPQISKTQPEMLAHHYTEALQRQEAINYWLLAGRRAIEHSANVEAIAHLNKGLELVFQIPDSAQRNENELRLLLSLGPALLSAKGLGSSEAESTYLRARELCRESDANAELFTVTWGLWLLCQKRGRLKEAQDFSSELLELAKKLNNSEYDLQAHHAAWTTNFRLSDFASCLTHTQQGLQLYDADKHRHHAMRFGGHDPGVCAHNNAAINAWLLGYAQQAQHHAQQAVQLANQIAHPFSQVLAHVFAGFVAQCCRNTQLVHEHAQAVMKMCKSRGIAPDCNAQAQVLEGWVQTMTNNIDNGIAIIEQAINTHRATGVCTHEPYMLTILAEAYARTQNIGKGLHAVNDALQSVKQTGERTFEAEIYRITGELLLHESPYNIDAALDCFQKAIILAQNQQSRSLELRAATSLVREQHKYKIKPDLNQLATLLDWFTEGQNMDDLKIAAGLIKELG